MRVAASVAAVAAMAGAGVVTAGSAQDPPPTVEITARADRLDVRPTGPLPAGPTRLAVDGGGLETEVLLAELRPGADRDAVTATLRRDPSAALEQIRLVASVALVGGPEQGATTVTLRPSSRYLLVNAAGDDPAGWELADLTTTDASSGAAPPSADARVQMVDLRFRGDAVLPREGVVRFENAGWAPHFAFAARLRDGASRRDVASALIANRDRALDRLLDGRTATEIQGLVTRGAVNWSEVRFPTTGRYLMACFFEGHHAQGMFRFVRVR